MKRIILLLLIAGLAFAQDAEERFTQCHRNCCVSSGGEWIEASESCDIGYESGGQNYDVCVDHCVDELYGELGISDGNICCGPAFLLLGLVFLAYKR